MNPPKNNPKNPPRFQLPTANNIREFLRSDRAILMLCIGIAFIFWLLTKLSYTYQSSIPVAIHYQIPSKKAFVEAVPTRLEVEVQGTGWDLMGTRQSDIDVEVNDGVPILSSSALEARLGRVLPSTLKIIGIHPDHIPMATEDTASKIVPVYPDIQLELDPQYHFVDSPQISPRQIRITGPASQIRDIQQWSSVPIIAQQVKATIRQELALKPHANPNIQFEPKTLNFVAEVEQITEKHLDIPLEIKNKPNSDSILLVLMPQKVHIWCRVGLSHYTRLSANDFSVSVDFNERNPQDNTIRVRLDKYPNYIPFLQFTPKKIDYILRNVK